MSRSRAQAARRSSATRSTARPAFPQAIGNPGSYASGGGLVSVLLPGMQVWGAFSNGLSGSAAISPYGTFGSTGTGGVGTYGLTHKPADDDDLHSRWLSLKIAGATAISASGHTPRSRSSSATPSAELALRQARLSRV